MIIGQGRKRPQLNIDIGKLHLDTKNPRLPEEAQNKSEEVVLQVLYRDFDLHELVESMKNNGYLDAEPLVAIPEGVPKKFAGIIPSDTKLWEEFNEYIHKPEVTFVVAEGNRRLGAAKILTDAALRTKSKIKDIPDVPSEIIKDLSTIPVIVYPDRESMVPYLGVKHIIGTKKWESYAKARYIASMKKSGYSLDQIEKIVGDGRGTIKRTYLAWKLVELMEEESEGSTKKAKENFSFILLSLGQASVKEYLGIASKLSESDLDTPINEDKMSNLKRLFSFLFGEGKEKLPVISESRDITNKLGTILRNPEAVNHLIATRNLNDSFDLTDGEEQLLIKKLKSINRNLEYSLGIVHRHRTDPVKEEIAKCKETIAEIEKVI